MKIEQQEKPGDFHHLFERQPSSSFSRAKNKSGKENEKDFGSDEISFNEDKRISKIKSDILDVGKKQVFKNVNGYKLVKFCTVMMNVLVTSKKNLGTRR